MPIQQRPLHHFFRLLNFVSGSEFAKRHGVNKSVEKFLYRSIKTGASAGQWVQSKFQPKQELLPEQQLQRAKSSEKELFDLTLTEEQAMIHDMLRRFSLDIVRPLAREADQSGEILESFFSELQSLGLNLPAIPEALGGVGTHRSPISSMLIAEDLAYGDMGLSIAALSSRAFLNVVTEFGSRAQQARYLPAFGTEETIFASLALLEQSAQFDPFQFKTHATKTSQGFLLNGTKCLVPLVSKSEVFLIFAELKDHGPQAFIVEANTPGLRYELTRHMGLKSAGFGLLSLNNVELTPQAQLGGSEVPYDHERLIDLCRIGLCALSLGTCQAVLDYVIPYCNTREAFGEPISHRQSIAFMMANIAIELEGMRLLTYRAASRAEQGLSFHREAYLAYTQCTQKAMEIGNHGVQLLGGHGYVCEHPIELWFRQLRAIGILEGTFAV